MKSIPGNSPLDTFLTERLKAADSDLLPVDWSEVEVLLRHEKKSISIGVSKKTVLLSVIGVVSVLLVFTVFQIVQHYASLPAKAEKVVAPTQNTFHVITDSSASVIKTAKIASSFTNEGEETPSDIPSTDTVSSKKTAPLVKSSPKQDKKKKQDTALVTTDTAAGKTKTEEVHPVEADTSSKYPLQEIKNENQPVADTTGKKFSLWWRKSKNKKSNRPVETKPDSLKQ